jgi:hypothetical protein
MIATPSDQRDDVVERPRLVGRLERLRQPGAAEGVVLLAAPPGFGKTTLVRSWLSTMPGSTAQDDAHLHGLLSRFQTLGLTVLEMRRLPD